MGHDLARTKVVIRKSPDTTNATVTTSPGACGTHQLPGSHSYLVLPETFILNYVWEQKRNQTKDQLRDIYDEDIEPNDKSQVLVPAHRYEMAHELAHVTCEHFLLRKVTQVSAALGVIAAVPLTNRLCGWSPRQASILSM